MAFDRRRAWKRVRVVWIALALASPFLMLLGFESAYLPANTLVSDDRVEIVLARDTFDFRPRPDDRSRAGLIFFPGGMVEPEAYAPMARALAEQGHHVVIIRLPFRLAPTETYQRFVFDTATQTMAATPRRWVIGGHSRGARIAADFAAAYPDRIAGLALIATTHPRRVSLAGLSRCVPVVKIAGTHDNIAPPDAMGESRVNLPPHTAYVEVAGANHRQFGYYRYQLLDGRAAISREEQQRRMIEGIMLSLRPQYLGGSGGSQPVCG